MSKRVVTKQEKILKLLSKADKIYEAEKRKIAPSQPFLQRSPKGMKVRRNDDNKLNRLWQHVEVMESRDGRRMTISYPAKLIKEKKPLSPKRIAEFRKGDDLNTIV